MRSKMPITINISNVLILLLIDKLTKMLTETQTAIYIKDETGTKKAVRRPLSLQDDSSDTDEDNKHIADAYRTEFSAAYDFEDDTMNASSDDDDEYAKVKNTLRPCDKYAESFYDINHDEYTNGAEDGQCPVFAKRSEYDDNGESTTDSESKDSGYNNESLDDSLHDRFVVQYDLFANDDDNQSETETEEKVYSYGYGDDECDQNYHSEYGIDDNEVNYIDY